MASSRWIGRVGMVACITSTPLAAQTHVLDDVLEPVREIRLEETAAHLVAAPRMAPDPRGGWLYWDGQGNDARRYDRNGRLLHAFGREGDGPGEFRRPLGVARLDDGRLVVLDARGRLSTWTATGDSLLDDVPSGVPRPRGFVPFGREGLVIYATPLPGDEPGRSGPVLHRLDLTTRVVTGAGFRFALSDTDFTAASSVESPPPVRLGDTLFVVLAPMDSIWAIPAGAATATRRIPIRSRALASSPPSAALSEGRSAFRAWVSESTFPGHFSPLPDGGWLVQTWGLRASGPTRGLVRLDPSGDRVWEVETTPELLAVDPTTGEILLWDPDGLEPALVRVVREREGAGALRPGPPADRRSSGAVGTLRRSPVRRPAWGR